MIEGEADGRGEGGEGLELSAGQMSVWGSRLFGGGWGCGLGSEC